MSKKRGKSSSAPGQGARWESGLIAAAVEEENWKVSVVFIVENQLEDTLHIKSLASAVKIPQRRLFSYVLKDDLMEMVEDLGNPKNKKTKEVPQFFEITEIMKGLMDAGESIPIHLWAKLIKFGVLNAKDADLKRRETEARSKEDKEKGGKGSGKKRPRSKSPGKGKGKKTPEPQLPKKDWSALKKRGEEDNDNKYIDDEPDDGPHHYIFISGFHQPQLLPILNELGVNVSSIIRIQSESYETIEKVKLQQAEAAASEPTKDEDALAAEKSKKEKSEKELAMFWKLLPVVLKRASHNSILQDLTRLEYIVKDIIHPGDWSDSENMLGFSTMLFEEIACLVYDSYDWRRQYLNYLNNMNLLHVPKLSDVVPIDQQPSGSTEEKSVHSATGKRDKGKAVTEAVSDDLVPPILTTGTSKDVDMRYYNDLMDLVPQESVSVPLIMHCMLEQITATEEDKTPPSEVPRTQRSDGIHLALADCISNALENLVLTEDERLALAEDFPSLNKATEDIMKVKARKAASPILMQYGDDTTVRTHFLEAFNNFNPKDAEEMLLHRLPVARLLNYSKSNPRFSREREARLQELLRHCATSSVGFGPTEAIPHSEVDRAFKQFVFETLKISTVDENGNIVKEESKNNPWDDPYTVAVQNLSDQIKSDMSVSDDAEESKNINQDGSIKENAKEGDSNEKSLISSDCLKQQRNLDSWCFAEHFHPEVLLQVLTEASEYYPCMDIYYHKRDNSLLVMFHCPMSKKLQAIKKWSASLHSDVGFRNYLEYVSPSINEWTKSEEEKYEAEQMKLELEKAAAQAALNADSSSTTPPPSTGAGKRPRSKSPKKGSRKGSASRSSSKIGGEDSQAYSSPFIRAGSLKAQSEDQAKIREEEEKRKAVKDSKQQGRVKSGDKGKQAKSASSKTSQDGKRPGSGKGGKSGRRGSKSRSRSRSRSGSREREMAPVIQEPTIVEPVLPFTGYDVGNNLINLSGKTSYLYPCDGGIIKCEKISYEQGSTTVSTSIKKDGHLFIVHMTDPKDPDADKDLDDFDETKKEEETTEKADLEAPEKEDSSKPSSQNSPRVEEKVCHSKFGSWTGTMCDGMTLSFSSHGEKGVCSAAAKVEERLLKLLGEIPPASSPSPVPPGMETPKKGGKGKKSPRGRSPRGKSPKGKRKSETEKEAESHKEEMRMQEELERKLQEAKQAEEDERRRIKLPPFNQLYTSTPDGLSIRYQLDPTDAAINYVSGETQFKLMVRQSYPYKTLGKQETESLRARPAMEEISRCIKSDGTVIKIMKDGSSLILFADGKTCFNQGSGPLVEERKIPVTPHSLPSAVVQAQVAQASEEQRNTSSPGSKKGSRGRKSSGKTNPEATATEPSLAGTTAGGGAAAAGLEADAGASAEADLDRAASWRTVCIDGERFITKRDGECVPEELLISYSATDPFTGEVMISREDHVIHVKRPDGSTVCEHADGTRITRYYREIEKSLYEAEGEDGDPSVTSLSSVQHVRVECPGYASVSFNCEEGSCLTVFGSGSTLLTTPESTYQLSHWNGGRIDIDQEGSVTYTPRPDNDLYASMVTGTEAEDGTNNEASVSGDNMTEIQIPTLGSYIMRHNSDICCEAIDHEGNVFQVKKDGEVNMINPTVETTSNGETGSVSVPITMTTNPLQHHPPRFFIIHNNCTGTELLRYKDVQEYLSDAEIDPTTAVIKEPLPDTPGVTGITVMRPHFGNSSEAWICHKMEENIIPENVRTRDLKSFPHKEEKKSGPAFGTTVGKGVAVGSAPAIPEPPPTPACPSVLELRQLVHFKSVSPELRDDLQKKLIEFGNHIKSQEMQRMAEEMQDPRSREERVRANDLLALVLEFDEQLSPKSLANAPQPSGGQTNKTDKKATPMTKAAIIHEHRNPEIIKNIYEDAVRPPPVPKPEPPKDKLTEADWERIRRSLEQSKQYKIALKNRDIPPYFESEQGRAWLLSQAPDMDALTRQLAPDPRKDGSEAKMVVNERVTYKRAGFPAEAASTPSQSRASENGISSQIPISNTSSKTRPTNPTPGHASGKGTPTKVRPENPTPIAASQSRTVRPSNPTPSHAYGGSHSQKSSYSDQPYGQYQPSPIPENPTSAQIREGHDPRSGMFEEGSSNGDGSMIPIENSGGSELVLTRSLLYDVNGEPRREKVRLPASILSYKPATVPNKQFSEVEEPVRRKVKTSSVSKGVEAGTAKRGFELLPPEIVFGILREGNTYSYTVRLKNTGIDTCRFKVKQPPPGTGLRVHYNPGPVAAGMDTLLHIECYAIAVGVQGDSGIGTINHQLEIVTEIETLFLPISAIVLTALNFDNREDSMPAGGKAPGVKLLSAKPPSREGIVRPMKIHT